MKKWRNVAPQFALRALLLAALVPVSLATEYVQYTSGATCEANGAGSIMTLEQCSAAAVALGLSDTTAQEDGQTGSWVFDPPYCYMGGGSLQFNSAGTNTGPCSQDPCLCVPVTTISVSGGEFNNAPYYTFDGGAPPTLEVGKTYRFVDGGVSGSHPFRIMPRSTMTYLSPPATITVGADDVIEYHCLYHANMKAFFPSKRLRRRRQPAGLRRRPRRRRPLRVHLDASCTTLDGGAPSGEIRDARVHRQLGGCSAAVAVGLSDTTAQEDGNGPCQDPPEWPDTGSTGPCHDPPYCYIGGGSLQINSAGTNTGPCSMHDLCLCVAITPITISVSGGDYAAPYYTFDGSAVAPTLQVGNVYTFVDGGVSDSHPFRIQGATKREGPPDGGLPITITVQTWDVPEYYCAAHSSMKAFFPRGLRRRLRPALGAAVAAAAWRAAAVEPSASRSAGARGGRGSRRSPHPAAIKWTAIRRWSTRILFAAYTSVPASIRRR